MGAGSVSTTQSMKVGSTVFLRTDSTTGYAGFSYTVPANSVLRITKILLSGGFSTPLYLRYGSPTVNMMEWSSSSPDYSTVDIPAGSVVVVASSAFQNVYVLGHLLTNSP